MCLVFIAILAMVADFGLGEVLPSKQDILNSVADVPTAENTLIFAHILFRHGDRTPTPASSYATDPNKYASYWPIGIGQLTKGGMLETYKLGLELRQRYDTFLGRTYFPDLIGALSSPKTRCQTSMQCVFAGLFSPSEEEKFLSDFQWRPIQYDILPEDQDDTFAMYECDNYWNLTNTDTNQTTLDFYDYLSNHTGEVVRNNSVIFLIHDAISVSKRMGKPQPDWVAKIYPEPLTSAAHKVYNTLLEQRLLLGASGFYRRVVPDTVNKIEGKLSPPRRKMKLYSAHEQTIIFALGGIKAYRGQVPKMASYLTFELHFINQTFGFKVFFQNYDQIAPVPINILQQGDFCPLDVFIEGTKWLTDGPKPFCK